MKNLIAIVFISIPLLGFSQDYVINVQGDTLKGDVKILFNDPVDQVVVKVDGKKNHLNALKAKEVKHQGQLYRSVRLDNTQKFMKVLISGYMSLYAFNPTGQAGFNGRLLRKVTGQSLDVPNLSFKKFMIDFTQECPDVSEKIKDETLKKNDLNTIITTFNQCLSTKTATPSPVTMLTPPSEPPVTDAQSTKIKTIENFQNKVDALANFQSKKSVTELLKDIAEKVKTNQTIWNYQIEALKGYFTEKEAMTSDLETLIATLTK